jgi:HlyD family secretion protein
MKHKTSLWVSLFLNVLLVAGLIGAAVYFRAEITDLLHDKEAPVQRTSPGEVLEGIKSFGQLGPSTAPAGIAALGRLQPEGGVINVAGLMGARLETLVVHEGEVVKKGQVLGLMDNHAEAEAQAATAAIQLAEAKARLEVERAYGNARIEEARIGVRLAAVTDPLDIQAQEVRVRILQDALAADLTDQDRVLSVAEGAISAQKVDQQKLVVRRDDLELQAAQLMLKKARESAKVNQDKAQAELAAAEAELRRLEASSPIESLTKSLALAQVHLDRTILKAPIDGTVLKVLTRPGESADRLPILKMGDTATMCVVAEVYETDIRHVRVGDGATIFSLVLPGPQPLTGRVKSIGQMIMKNDILHLDPAADADARVVEVLVVLDPLKPGTGLTPAQLGRLTNLQVDVKINVTQRAGGTGVDPARTQVP